MKRIGAPRPNWPYLAQVDRVGEGELGEFVTAAIAAGNDMVLRHVFATRAITEVTLSNQVPQAGWNVLEDVLPNNTTHTLKLYGLILAPGDIDRLLGIIRSMPRLERLQITHSSLAPTAWRPLIRSLQGCETLTNVELTHCDLSTMADAEPVLLAPLAHLPGLFNLNLSGCQLGHGVLSGLLSALHAHPCLHTLGLNGITLVEADVAGLASLIAQSGRLAVLYLDCFATDDELGPLVDAVARNLSLQELYFELDTGELCSYEDLPAHRNARALAQYLGRNNAYPEELEETELLASLEGALTAVLAYPGQAHRADRIRFPPEIARHAAGVGFRGAEAEDACALYGLRLINKAALQAARDAEARLRQDVHLRYQALARTPRDDAN